MMPLPPDPAVDEAMARLAAEAANPDTPAAVLASWRVWSPPIWDALVGRTDHPHALLNRMCNVATAPYPFAPNDTLIRSLLTAPTVALDGKLLRRLTTVEGITTAETAQAYLAHPAADVTALAALVMRSLWPDGTPRKHNSQSVARWLHDHHDRRVRAVVALWCVGSELRWHPDAVDADALARLAHHPRDLDLHADTAEQQFRSTLVELDALGPQAWPVAAAAKQTWQGALCALPAVVAATLAP